MGIGGTVGLEPAVEARVLVRSNRKLAQKQDPGTKSPRGSIDGMFVRSRIVREGSTHCHIRYTTVLRNTTIQSCEGHGACLSFSGHTVMNNNRTTTNKLIQNTRKHRGQHSRTFSFRSSDPRETKVKEMVSMRLCLTFVFCSVSLDLFVCGVRFFAFYFEDFVCVCAVLFVIDVRAFLPTYFVAVLNE